MARDATALDLTAPELRAITKWPEPVIVEFLALVADIAAIDTTIADALAAFLIELLADPHTWAAKQTFSAYTVLGDASIKVKKLAGTTDAVAGNTVSIAHGVTLAKIISVTGLVNDGTVMFFPCSPTAADEFSLTADATNVNVINGATATTILAQPFTITVVYEE